MEKCINCNKILKSIAYAAMGGIYCSRECAVEYLVDSSLVDSSLEEVQLAELNSKKKFIFTFNNNTCQPIYADDAREARKKMLEVYGNNWSFQYTEEEWERAKNDPNQLFPLEKELPPIYA